MPLISVLTTTREDSSGELWAARAARSIANQALLDGWELEWLIQSDGTPRAASAYQDIANSIVSCPTSSAGLAHRAGVAVARNAALSRARGDLVCTLDDDDELTTDSIILRHRPLAESPSLFWCAGLMRHFDPDNGLVHTEPQDPPFGLITPEVALAHLAPNRCFPVYAATLLMSTQALRAIGGWPAYINGEDNVMMSALTGVFDGWYLNEVVYEYHRRHQSLSTNEASSQFIEIYRPAQYQRTLAAIELLRPQGPGLT